MIYKMPSLFAGGISPTQLPGYEPGASFGYKDMNSRSSVYLWRQRMCISKWFAAGIFDTRRAFPAMKHYRASSPDRWLSPEEQTPASRIDGGIAVSAFRIVLVGRSSLQFHNITGKTKDHGKKNQLS